MTTLRQAAELALEAMKDFDYDKRMAAIEAVEKALAECRSNELQELNQEPKATQEWVGLKNEEIYPMYNEPSSDAEMITFARAIEAKLKEKNT